MASQPKKAAAQGGSNTTKYIIAAVVVVILIAAIGGGIWWFSNNSTAADADQTANNAATDNGTTEDTSGLYTPEYIPNGKEVAVIKTSQGTIKVELDGKDAPITVGNFVELAQKGFYDGTKFHRYEPDFVIQGGDPQTKDATAEEVAANANGLFGTGGPGYSIKEEYSTNPNNTHLDGALAMARSEDPNSAGSQFYFTLGEQSFLDPNYTVFGQTLEGKDVIAKLRAGDEIESITIENAN